MLNFKNHVIALQVEERSKRQERKEEASVTRIIKTQRQILGFNLMIRKAKWPAAYLYLRSKWPSCLHKSSDCDSAENCLLFYIPF